MIDPTPVIAIAAVVAGVPAGALVTWFVHGWQEGPDELSVRVATSCPECGHDVTPTEAVSLRVLAPHCRCGARRPRSWWVAPVAVPLGWAASVVALGVGHDLPAVWWLTVVLAAASVVDLRLMLIPRRIVHVGLAVGAGLLAAATALDGPASGVADLVGAMAGCLACALFLYLFHRLMPGGLGFGDVRLALLLGAYLGWYSPLLVAVGVVLGCLIGIAFGLAAQVGFRRPFPFGPGLALGTLTAIWAHGPILDALTGVTAA